MMKKLILASLVLISSIVIASNGYALSFYGDGVWGDFSGSLNYAASDANNATLIVQLTNTSPAANGGYITGFLFNNPSSLISAIPSYSFSDGDFNMHFVNDGVNGAPFGQFDIAASLGKNPGSDFADGGNPADGITVGGTGTFTFNLTGSSLDSLTDASFVGSNDFYVRFRGFDNEQSDKVPPVPEPMTMLLFGPALLGLIGIKKKLA